MAKKNALQFYLNLGGKQLVDDIKLSDKEIDRHGRRFNVKKHGAGPWQTPGAVKRVLEYGKGLLFVCERGLVELHWIAADCIRVRLRTVKGDFPPPFSHAVAKPDWPLVPVETIEGEEALEMRSASMVCRVGKQPLRLGIETLDGDLICVDHAGMRWQPGGEISLSMALFPDESCYGLGERAFALNLRGRRYKLWNQDPGEYGPGTDPLYHSVPFYLGVHNQGVYGLFWDNPCRGIADLGESTANQLTFQAERGELRYYLFAGNDVNTVLSRFTELTGRINLPPLWALGYHQSRFSYSSQDMVLKVASEFRERDIPCDAICLDIHYMDGFRPFTWNRERFPNLQHLTSQLHQRGFRVVAALNPGIKVDAQYSVYLNGSAQDVFLKYPDGEVVSAASWSGLCHLPDFTRPETGAWWAQQANDLIEAGIDGFLNAMSEPTVLSEEGVQSLPDYIPHDNEGLGGDHRDCHNVYGMLMAGASMTALQQYRLGQRPWNMSCSGYAGAQRYAATCTGSNASDWDHLRMSISMVLNMGLSGSPLVSADIGGVRGNADGELFTRWLQAACLLPLFRSHSETGTLQHEPWAFGQPFEVINRVTIQLRYRLLPYLYSVIAQCKEFGWPVVRPLFMAEPDNPGLRSVDDCYMVGDIILVAPVVDSGVVSRKVYLPVGQWYDYWTNDLLEGGQEIEVPAPLERLPLFVRAGAVLPVLPEMQYTSEKTLDTLTLRVYPGHFETVLYEDKGEGLDYEQGQYRWVYVTCAWEESRLTINRRVAGRYEPGYSKIKLEVIGFDEKPMEVRADRQGAPLWFYDDGLLELTVDAFSRIEIRRKPLPTDRTILRRPW
jgi:alpha-glucosidase